MKTYLENIKTGEKRNFPNSTTATKRLWEMPLTHRKEWQVVDEEMGFSILGDDTTTLVVFLNPYNWENCLSNPEEVMQFDFEEFKKTSPSSTIKIKWYDDEEEIVTRFKDKEGMKEWADNYVGDLGDWKFI